MNLFYRGGSEVRLYITRPKTILGNPIKEEKQMKKLMVLIVGICLVVGMVGFVEAKDKIVFGQAIGITGPIASRPGAPMYAFQIFPRPMSSFS
jgi:hypothetical protein